MMLIPKVWAMWLQIPLHVLLLNFMNNQLTASGTLSLFFFIHIRSTYLTFFLLSNKPNISQPIISPNTNHLTETVNIITTNVRSQSNYLNLQISIEQLPRKPHIIIMTETWLTKHRFLTQMDIAFTRALDKGVEEESAFIQVMSYKQQALNHTQRLRS